MQSSRCPDDGEEAVTGHAIGAKDIGELELEAAQEPAVGVLHLELEDGVDLVDTVGVDFHGGRADHLVVEQVGKEVDPGQEGGALAEPHKVGIGVDQSAVMASVISN